MAPKKQAENAEDVEVEPDPPVIKDLKALDDKYLEIEREFEKELGALRAKYIEKQSPILQRRGKLLLDAPAGDDANSTAADRATGTPGLKGFWHQALSNHPDLGDLIEEWDQPVLEYLRDIIVTNLNPEQIYCGWRLTFHFAENPYFENAVLSQEFHCEEKSPYRGSDDKQVVHETKGCTIKWKKGKDVTVAVVPAKVGRGKKAKAGKPKEEPQSSFFREMFRKLKEGDPLPDDVDPHMFDMMHGSGEDIDMKESDIVEQALDVQYRYGLEVRKVVYHAVRWYTGEASPESDSDDDEDDEEESDDDENEEDDEGDDDEEEKAPKRNTKKGQKHETNKGAAEADKKEQKTQECKQQ